MSRNRYHDLLARLKPSQAEAVHYPDNVLLLAAAGAGKTTVLVARFLEAFRNELLRDDGRSVADRLSSIAAITFTEKAAAEMKQRTRDLLLWALLDLDLGPQMPAARLWRQARDAMTSCSIGTIHAFCASILRKFPLEAGLDPEFTILDETQSYIMRHEAVESYFTVKAATEQGAGELGSLLSLYPRARLVAILLALMDRFAELRPHLELYAEAPEHEIAIKIQNILSDYAPEPKKKGKSKTARYDAFVETKRLRKLSNAAIQAASIYTSRKLAVSVLDFNDLEQRLMSLLSGPHTDILERVRSELTTILIDEFQDTNRFQWRLARILSAGTNRPFGTRRVFAVGDQRQSIYAFRGADLRAFGDAMEEVTGSGCGKKVQMQENFRSLPDIIAFINLIFQDHFVAQHGDSAPMVAARESSDAGGVGTVEVLLPSVEGRRKVGVQAEADLIARRIAAMVSGWEDGTAKSVFDRDRGRFRPCGYEDIALLISRRTYLGVYQDALRSAGVPFSVTSDLGFYQRQEIKDVYCLFRVLCDLSDDVALVGVLRSPFFSVSVDGLFWLTSLPGDMLFGKLGSAVSDGFERADAWADCPLEPLNREALLLAHSTLLSARKSAEVLPPVSVVQLMLERTGALAGYAAQSDGAQTVANLDKLQQLLNAWAAAGHRSTEDVVRLFRRLMSDRVREGAAQTYEGDMEGVRISTIHGAKGLEFPVVIVADVFAKPHWGATDDAYIDPDLGIGIKVPGFKGGKRVDTQLREAIKGRLKASSEAEMTRLWYVACTRARDHLLLSGAISQRGKGSLGSMAIDALGIDAEASGNDRFEIPLPGMKGPVVVYTSASQIPARKPQEDAALEVIKRMEDLACRGDGLTFDGRPHSTSFSKYLGPLDEPWFEPQVSPSGLDAYAACPRRYLIEHILSPPSAVELALGSEHRESEETAGAAFGTLVHSAFQHARVSDASGDAALVASLAGDPSRSAAAEALREMLATFRRSKLQEMLRSAKRVRREVAFTLRHHPVVLRGVMDLLFDGADGRVNIVDYKTDVESVGLERRYKAQMAAYVLATSSLFKTAPSSVSIYLARVGGLLPVAVGDDTIRWVGSVIAELHQSLQCARSRPYLLCFEERPEACEGCYDATKAFCLRLGTTRHLD